MRDPFPVPASPLLQTISRPIANLFSLPTLPLHIHEIAISTLLYTFIYAIVSPRLSPILFPRTYPNLNVLTKRNWDVHVVSLVQSSFINVAALWVMWNDSERWGMGWEERVWGYSGAAGMIQAFAVGYFVWDLAMCAANIEIFGVGMLAHAVSALMVFALGFRPFVNFYGPTFILYEISSPFLNFHWFFDKLGMTGSLAQWYNGILLLFSFFCCRLLWGTYQSIRVYQDVWAALHYDPLTHPKPASVYTPAPESGEMLMQYAGDYFVPKWLAVVYLAANIVLNTLNFYWYGKMIETIKKRFTEAGGKTKGGVGVSAGAAGRAEKEEGVLVEGMMDSSTIISDMVEEDGTVTEAWNKTVETKEAVEYTVNGQNVTDDVKTGLERVMMNGGSFIEVEQTQIRRRNQAGTEVEEE